MKEDTGGERNYWERIETTGGKKKLGRELLGGKRNYLRESNYEGKKSTGWEETTGGRETTGGLLRVENYWR